MRPSATRRELIAAAAAGLTAATLPLRAETGAVHEVEIRDFAFVPEELTVHPGDTVRWVNRGATAHTATAFKRGWRTDRLWPGASAEVAITTGMEAEYFCSIHRAMRGRLVIIED